jgi:hypothetical protein
MLPPVPKFILEDELWWTTTALLPSWKGFQIRKGAYDTRESNDPSDGTVKIVFAPEGRGNEPLTPSEISSIIWAIDNEAALSEAVLSCLAQEYASLQQQYDYSGEQKAELMPNIKSSADLHALIGLHTVNIHQIQRNGIPYVGFEFGCTWDEEHGLGVLMHGTRMVQIGGADAAILLWIAERDAARLNVT